MGKVLSEFRRGWPGAVTRSKDDVVVSLKNADMNPIAFGAPVFLDAAAGGAVNFAAGETAAFGVSSGGAGSFCISAVASAAFMLSSAVFKGSGVLRPNSAISNASSTTENSSPWIWRICRRLPLPPKTDPAEEKRRFEYRISRLQKHAKMPSRRPGRAFFLIVYS